jgi:peptidoglycan/LPS O-acetylase OafA/YrhL
MRVEQLTFTRFVAAVSIVIYHFGTDIYPFSISGLNFLFKHADIGVSYFFILSGFVMIIAYNSKGSNTIAADRYYVNRFSRIYPAYLLAALLYVLYFLVRNKNLSPGSVGLNLLVLQSWLPPYPLNINPPGWSLTVEFFFYALFPFLFNSIYLKISLRKLFLPIILFWISTQVFFNIMVNSQWYEGLPSKSHDLLFYFPLMHLNEFLIGNLGGLFLLKYRNYLRNFDRYIFVLIFLFLLLYRLPMNFHDGLMAFVFLPFILLLSLNNGFLTRLFSKKPLVFLGEISYGIYIYQIPVFFWVTGFLKYIGLDNANILFYFPFACLIVFSGLSYVYIEKPVRDAINMKYLKRKPEMKLNPVQ